MRIGFVTDEISSNVEEALKTGISWGIHDYELRVIGENRVPDISAGEVEKIISLRNELGFRITALSPGTFKGTIHDKTLLQREVEETLPKTFELAKALSTNMIIVFGIQRSEQDNPVLEDKVIALFHRVAESAEREGLLIAVENEPGFWCDSGANTAALLEKVGHQSLRANWDPGNSVGTDEPPFPDGYHALKKWIVNLHIKDTIKGALVECVPIGEGAVDWPGQLSAVVKDNLLEHVTIETHCLPLIENSKRNLKIVREILMEEAS